EPDIGVVGSTTRFAIGSGPGQVAPASRPSASATRSPVDNDAQSGAQAEHPSTAAALLAGLDNEVELMTGWFSLLATSQDLATSWKLPTVAGMLLEGPNGCGKSELVREAARRAGTQVSEVDISRVFKPEKLLDRLSTSVNAPSGPRVIFVDRLETLTGDDALSTFRTQFVAVLRWFLEEVAAKPQVVCVLGVDTVADLHNSIAKSPLLPRVVSIPPPDLDRRQRLFEAAFSRVPGADDIDSHRLATLSSGYSGADVLAAVVHASSMVTGNGEALTTEIAVEALESTTPSLGSVPMGEITGFGFEKVANLADVKQRLTEAVIWPMTQPERYERLGIEPPKGIMLYGPPGTGKTFVVKALAHEAGSAFFAVKGAELLDKYVGESERAVRTVFSRARDAAPSIIFFDEFDALAPVRGNSSSSVSDQVVAALLTEIDGVSDRGQVSVIAATNRLDLIDGALLRAGRFETHIKLDLPVKSARLALLKITDVSLAEDVDCEELAAQTDGLSFADLTGVLREAALATLRRDETATEVGWSDLEAAIALFDDRRGPSADARGDH
ncbi:MAG: ATP-binding protein, partial [Ilumatobacter sp.]|uniref:AAA family ATPase n=1 Tax=Ilumatobacter sp. TaxID=1967498 RepID=UPI0037539F1D|nr:ATP-binding protein [Ilumatobacter sp.]